MAVGFGWSVVWCGGSLVAGGEVVVGAFDSLLCSGLGVFETLLVSECGVVAWSLHAERLVRGARALGLPEPDVAGLRAAVDEVVGACESLPARLRVTFGAEVSLVTAVPYVRPEAPRLVTSRWTLDPNRPTAGCKTTSYADWSVMRSQALADGADEAVYYTPAGHLCEGTTSNIIVAIGNELFTPPLSDGPLPGITRHIALHVAHNTGIPLREQTITAPQMRRSDAVAMTSSLRGIQTAASLDQRSLTEHPALNKLAHEYETFLQQNPDPAP